VPSIAVQPRLSTVDPISFLPLKWFSCGRRSRHHRDADKILKMLRGGKTIPMTVRAAQDAATGQVMAVSAYADLSLLPDDDDAPIADDSIHIGLVAVNRAFHGTLIEGAATLGDFMLHDLLKQVTDAAGGETPPLWSLVGRDNQPAIRLARAHDFELRPMTSEHFLAFRERVTPPTD
jgi:hypothetical protein